jgi:hypothetical protein
MNLPIAERELRVASRNPKISRARWIACLVFSGILAWFLWAMREAFHQNGGGTAFLVITNIALIVCMFSSNYTADAISSEKRGGTLGFLFLTDLKPRDVIFGKLAAVGLVTFYTLLGLIPILSILILMGGVTGQAIFQSALVLLNSLFFALAIGIWVSTKQWEQKKAFSACAWRTALFLWGFPLFAAIADFQVGWKRTSAVLQILSPFYQLQYANAVTTGLFAGRFWTSLAVMHGLAWLALWRACRVVPHVWQDRPEPIKDSFKERWNNLRFGASAQRARLRRALLDLNAFHWFTSRDRWAPVSMWIFLASLFLVWCGLWFWIGFMDTQPPPFWGPGIPIIFVAQIGLILKAAAISSEALERDRLNGSLELLLSTSLAVSDIARGIWLSLRRTVLKPALTTVAVGALLFVFLFRGAEVSERGPLFLLFLCLNVLFGALLISSVQTGMWMACVSNKSGAAAGMVVLRLAVVPLVLFLATMTLFEFLDVSHWDFTPYFVWFLLFLGAAVFWFRRSHRRFYECFRVAAAQRFDAPSAKPSWWRAVFLPASSSRQQPIL